MLTKFQCKANHTQKFAWYEKTIVQDTLSFLWYKKEKKIGKMLAFLYFPVYGIFPVYFQKFGNDVEKVE